MLDVAEYERWTALEMADLVRTGEVTAAELRETCLRLIEERDPLVGAVAELRTDAPGAPDGRGDGPFAGVPFAVKELLAVPGLPWSLGSRLCATQPPLQVPEISRRYAEAGLDVVCSTKSSEFGLLGSTESLLRGPARNPWDLALSPAGSSGGAAALVAAGILPVAHANDGGGSIRVPASVCGLFGFKPSNARAAGSGLGEGLGALVVDHVISRSVADSAALFACTERTSPGERVGRVREPGARRLRIGVQERTLLGVPADAPVLAQLAQARALCEALGHTTVDVPALDVDGQAISDGFFTLAGRQMGVMAESVAPLLGREPGPDELEPFTLELIAHARALPQERIAAIQADFEAAGAAYNRVFDAVDVVLSPTVTRLPWPHGTLDPAAGRETLIRRTEAIAGFTPVHNVSGAPAMSVPLGRHEGLPVGMHFAAAPGRDAVLLGLALELEAAAPWAAHRPTLGAAAGAV